MSRDREGAVRLLLRYPERHWLPLPINYVPDCCSNVVPIQQPSGATVPRPSCSARAFRTDLVQSPARIGFERVHHFLRFRVSFHHRMNVSRPNMRRQKCPLPVQANLSNCVQHYAPARLVQHVRSLVHQLELARCARSIALSQPVSRNVVVPIHGTRFVAVHMRAIARERNQVRHARLFYTAPSRSRLGKARSFSECVRHNVQHYKHIRGFL